jgi:EmrB/QacA subfamily drug resistance transporter
VTGKHSIEAVQARTGRQSDPPPPLDPADGSPDRSAGSSPPGQGAGQITSEQSMTQQSAGESEPNPHRWRALAVCLVGGFIVLLDVSIVNVALPSIRSGLDASSASLQWVLSGYALSFGLILVPAGRLGDMRGRRTMFIVGVGLFTLASAACGAAQGSTWLAVARIIQGLAGGLITPQISALIQELFSGKERGKAFGLFGAVVGISTAIGPLLGGVLISAFGEHEGWRWVFYVNVPIGVVAIPLAWKLIPAPAARTGKNRQDLDPVGVVLLALGVVVLLLPFLQQQEWPGNTKWLLLIPAAALLIGFVFWERRYEQRDRQPVVNLSLFKIRSYSFGTGLISLYFAGFTPLFFVLTLLLQSGLQYSALAAGLATVPFALGSGVAAALGGRIVQRFGQPLVVIGLVIVAVGFAGVLVAVHLVPRNGTGWALLVPLLVAGIGSGLVISPNQTITLSEVPVERAGTAGGLLQTGQRIGSAIGIAAVGAVFFAQVGSDQNFDRAFEHGLVVAMVFVAAALVLSIVDVLLDRIHRRTDDRAGTGRAELLAFNR